MQSGGKEPDHEPLSRSEKHYFSKYGRLPRGGPLGQKSKERTYFDSGDFALSTTDKVTDNGAIQTGSAHPHRNSISHPFAAIPAASNVDVDANEDLYSKSVGPKRSPLLQQTNVEDEEATNKEGQGNPTSHEG
ncbi:hypothetical protein BDW59DRAFT_36057 [Aspergillus cavernicola]|uniref:mRNA stability protein n=1 Tax=Aspergillus cavernicola TaxID=176166 RepID=A0ABR4IRH6_9EURO